MKPPLPNPGSDAAIKSGCTCPVMDNEHGKGALGNPGMFWYAKGCPLHHPMYAYLAPAKPKKCLACPKINNQGDVVGYHKC